MPHYYFTAPSGDPELVLHPNFVESVVFGGYLHTCSAIIGYPADKNLIYVGFRITSSDGSSDFTYSEDDVPLSARQAFGGYEYLVPIQGSEKIWIFKNEIVEENCVVTQTIEFLLELESRWNGGNITCFVYSKDNQSIISSTTQEMAMIGGKYPFRLRVQ